MFITLVVLRVWFQDLPQLNAWVALYQLGFNLVLAPASFLLQRIDNNVHLSKLPENLWFGVKCMKKNCLPKDFELTYLN